jgi:hypothetical protein
MPKDSRFQPIQFNEDEIVLSLNDRDEKGLLFEKKF